MSKKIKSSTVHPFGHEKAKTAPGIPLIVFIWTIGLGMMGYVVSSVVFNTHPLHWASGAVGLVLGAVIGYIWYRKRGDVAPF